MKRTLTLACFTLLVWAAPATAGERLFAITDAAPPHIVSLDSGAPGAFLTDTPVTGIGAGETIVGLDTRPRPGPALYVLTRDGSGTGRLYTVDPGAGAVTPVATLTADPADSTNPYTALPAAAY